MMHHLKPLLAFVLMLANIGIFAQEKTLNNKNLEAESNPFRKAQVLLIPFDQRMYFSEFDRELSEKEQLTFHQIRDKFRKAIDTSLYSNILMEYSVNTLLKPENADAEKDLIKIQSAVTLNYEAKPSEAPKKAKGKAQSKTNEEVNLVRNGQLDTRYGEGEKYMAVKASNLQAFQELHEKYGSEYFVFINQVDIKREKGATYSELEQNNFQKEIRLHYTIINMKGERIASGVSTARISANENSLPAYISKGVRPAAAAIAGALPKAEN
jgi:hypothetical protein